MDGEGETQTLDFTQSCFTATNPNLLVCESDYGDVVSHDVHRFDLDKGQWIISYNGFPNPQTHTFELIDFEGTPGDWTMTVEAEERFGSQNLNRKMVYDKDADRMTLTISDRPIGSDEPFEWTRTHTYVSSS